MMRFFSFVFDQTLEAMNERINVVIEVTAVLIRLVVFCSIDEYTH